MLRRPRPLMLLAFLLSCGLGVLTALSFTRPLIKPITARAGICITRGEATFAVANGRLRVASLLAPRRAAPPPPSNDQSLSAIDGFFGLGVSVSPRLMWRVDPPAQQGGPSLFTLHDATTGARWLPAVRNQLHSPNAALAVTLISLPLIPLTILAAILCLLLGLRSLRHPPDHCHRCGYDLTGNLSGRCPECGHDLDLARPVDPTQP